MKISQEKIFSDSIIQNLIGQNNYAAAAEQFFELQIKSWELMKTNYDALKDVQIKSFWYDGFKLNIQFNPHRIKSTSAEVDEISIANRSCFLCIKNLPEEQKGIYIKDKYVLLCNPYPILPQHFTIAVLEHEPQAIAEYFSNFLEFSKMLSDKYSLIYNGPACGASAPDHLHFQAVTKNSIPIENEIQQIKNNYGKVIHEVEDGTITFINDGLRRIIFMESTDQIFVKNNFSKIIEIYGKLTESKPEPMLNLICSYDKEFGWSLIIFLRSKHRPNIFFKNDPDRILISPAAIDLGGLIITPRVEDFNKVDKASLQKIIDEVSLDPKTFESIIKLFEQS